MFNLNTLKSALCISFVLSLLGNNIVYSDVIKDKGKAELLIAQLNPVGVASGRFVQRKYFKVLKQPIKSRGELYFEKDLGFLWQTNQPVYSKMLLKNDGLYTENGIQPITEIKGAGTIASVMMKAMIGDINGLEQDFFIVLATDETCVVLTPKAQQLAQVIRSISLCNEGAAVLQNRSDNISQPLASKNMVLNTRIVLFEQSGNRTEIDLQLSPIASLPEAIRAQLQ